MISKEDAMFTIGYEGLLAVVDGKAKARYGKLSALELARKGLFRAAFTAILHANDQAQFRAFADHYNQAAGTKFNTIEEFKRLFGVNIESIKRTMVL
jgi:hypothetical protein